MQTLPVSPGKVNITVASQSVVVRQHRLSASEYPVSAIKVQQKNTRQLQQSGKLPVPAWELLRREDMQVSQLVVTFSHAFKNMSVDELSSKTNELHQAIEVADSETLLDKQLIAHLGSLEELCEQRQHAIQNMISFPGEEEQLADTREALAACQRVISQKTMGEVPLLNIIPRLHSLAALDVTQAEWQKSEHIKPEFFNTISQLRQDSEDLSSMLRKETGSDQQLRNQITEIKQHLPVAEWLKESSLALSQIKNNCPIALVSEAAEQLMHSVERLSLDFSQHVLTVAPQQQTSMEKIRAIGHNLFTRTDIYGALSQQDSKMFTSQLRGQYASTIDGWMEYNQQLDHILSQAEVPAKIRRECHKQLSCINRTLSSLRNGVPFRERLWLGLSTLLAYPMPLAVPLISGEKAYSSTLIPHFAKNACLLMGLIANDTTDSGVRWRHFTNRLFINTMIGIAFFGTTMADHFHATEQELGKNIPLNVCLGALAGVATFTWFNSEKVMSMLRQASEKMTGLLFKNPQGSDFEINPGAREHILHCLDHLKTQKQVLENIKSQFIQEGKQVNDTINSQLTAISDAIDKLVELFEPLPEQSNPVHIPKMGLTGTTGVICAGVVALMIPDLVGAIDYVIDGALCVSEMVKEQNNPNADMQKAIQTFKELVGLNLTMVLYLTPNKFIDFLHNSTGYSVGTAAMTLANLTIPGMVGSVAGDYAGKAIVATVDGSRKGYAWMSELSTNMVNKWYGSPDGTNELNLAERGEAPPYLSETDRTLSNSILLDIMPELMEPASVMQRATPDRVINRGLTW